MVAAASGRRRRAGLVLAPLLPVLLLLAAASGGRPDRKRPPGATAREARDAAAEAFYRMDRIQGLTRSQVDSFTGLFAGTSAAQVVRGAFDGADEQCDAAARGYIEALDRHDVDADLPRRDYQAAEEALLQAARACDLAAQQLGVLRERHAGELARVGEALARLGPHVLAAQEALLRAQRAVAELAGQDLRSVPATEALNAAQAAADVLAQGVERLGLTAALRQAELVTASADRAHGLALELPRRREAVTTRLVSLRSRNEAVGYRVPGVEARLSELRRGYSEKSWRDVADAPAVMRDRSEQAARLRRVAEAAAAAGDYDGASAALREATQALADAERREQAVDRRRAALQEAAHDPGARVTRVRFALRDAQRLVMAEVSSGPAPPRWAARLDPLVGRLERAEGALAGTHPDYWAFLVELDAITAVVQDVVAEVRSERGHVH